MKASARRPACLVILFVTLLSGCSPAAPAAVSPSAIPATVPASPVPTAVPDRPVPATAAPVATVPATAIPITLDHQQAVRLFDYDSAVPLDIRQVSKKDADGVTIFSITYASYSPDFGINGRTLAYLVVPPGKGPFAGIVFMHWVGTPNGSREEFLDEAVALAHGGAVSLLVQGTFPWTVSPSGYESDRIQVIKQVTELRRGLDLLLAREDVDPARIAYVGHDYGALYGGILAGVEKRVKTYVLMTGMGNFSDWALQHWPASAGDSADVYRQAMAVVDPIAYVGDAAPASLFYQFARGDRYIPEAKATEYYDAGSEPKQVKWYETSHALILDEALRDRDQWLAQQLGLESAQ